MTFFILSVIISMVIGVQTLFLCFPLQKKNQTMLLLGLCMGTGLGVGLTSCVYFIAMLFNQMNQILIFELVVTGLLSTGCYLLIVKGKHCEVIAVSDNNLKFKWSGIITGLFSLMLFSSFLSIVISFLKEPHGRWDAWLIWNMHARFIYRCGEAWRNLFGGGLEWTHLDYPLLLPLSVVRSWQYSGIESVYAPMVISLLFTFALIGLLTISLSLLRSKNQGYLGGLFLMGSPFFLIIGVYQVADIPLAFFLLTTLVVFFFHDRFSPGRHQLLLLAGVAAGLAVLTKNEGVLFLILAIIVRFAVITYTDSARDAVRQTLWFMTGALPLLILLAYFKTQLAPPSEIFSGQSLPQFLARLSDPQRYYEIIKAYLQTGFSFTQGVMNIRTGMSFNMAVANVAWLVFYLVFMGVTVGRMGRSAFLTASLVLFFMLTGFFCIYLITPHDLHWHLYTSLNRLFMQLWPSIIFLGFMTARTPEEMWPVAVDEFPLKESMAVRQKQKKAGKPNNKKGQR